MSPRALGWQPVVPPGSGRAGQCQGWHWGPRKGEAGVCWLPGLRCPGPCHCPGDTLLGFPWSGAALQLQAWLTPSPTGCLHDTGHVPKGNPMASAHPLLSNLGKKEYWRMLWDAEAC